MVKCKQAQNAFNVVALLAATNTITYKKGINHVDYTSSYRNAFWLWSNYVCNE